MKLKLPAYSVKLPEGREVRLQQKDEGENSYVELRMWRRVRRKGWVPTESVRTVPCGELAEMWDRMTTELNSELESVIAEMQKEN